MGSFRPRWRLLATALPASLALAAAATACVSLDGLTGGGDDGDAGLRGGDGAILADASGPGDPSDPIHPTPGPASNDAGASTGDPVSDDASPTAPPPLLDAGCTNDAAMILALGAPLTASPPFGGDSGVAFADTCPAGSALVGLRLVADMLSPYALYQVEGLCATVSMGACSGALSFGAPTPLGIHGDGVGEAGTLQCPPGSVVVGMSSYAAKFIHSVTLQCAAVHAAAGAAGAAAPITLGAGTFVGPFGGAGGDATAPFQCPTPSVANALSGTAGGTDFIDSLVLGCATPLRN